MVIPSAFVGLTFCLSQFLPFLFSYTLIDSDASSSYLKSKSIVSVYLLANSRDSKLAFYLLFSSEFQPKPLRNTAMFSLAVTGLV